MNKFLPRLIAGELTWSCDLKCVHCRARAFVKYGDYLEAEPLLYIQAPRVSQ